MATTRAVGGRRGRTVRCWRLRWPRLLRLAGRGVGGGRDDHPGQARQGDAVRAGRSWCPRSGPARAPSRSSSGCRPDAPIGEVYPLSVDGWAPLITARDLDAPVAGIHAPAVSTVTSAVVWTRGGRAGNPGSGPARGGHGAAAAARPDDLRGGADRTPTARWCAGPTPVGGGHPAPTLALVPPAARCRRPGTTAAQPTAGRPGRPGRRCGTAPTTTGTADPSADRLLGGGLLIGLGGGAAVGWVASRSRRRAAADAATDRDDDPTSDDPTPGDRGWRLDGPAPGEPADTDPERVAAR